MALITTRKHVLYDIWLEDSTPLRFVETWNPLLREAAEAGNATILHEQFHQFKPQGITGFLLLAESHISVHTWPEEKFAAIDIFTCGKLDPGQVIDYLRRHLVPIRERLTAVDRA